MKSALVLIAVLGALVWAWRDAMRARERAVRLARDACRRRDLQLLDDTVALARLGLARRGDGRLGLRRIYHFECSGDGRSRLGGMVVLAAGALESLHVPDATAPGPERPG